MRQAFVPLGSTTGRSKASVFGQQTLSTRRTSPDYGFGSGTREDRAKLFAGALTESGGQLSPGPCYDPPINGNRSFNAGANLSKDKRFGKVGVTLSPGPAKYNQAPSSVGHQVISDRQSFPKYGFGTCDRDRAAKASISPLMAKGWHGVGSPGPANLNNAFPSMSEGKKWGFATDGRWTRRELELSNIGELPGPASFNTRGAAHISSKDERQPRYGFGSGSREQSSKLFAGHQFAKSAPHLTYSPGPGTATHAIASSLGKQASSRGRTGSAWGFGSAQRFPKPKDDGTPGPGAYGL